MKSQEPYYTYSVAHSGVLNFLIGILICVLTPAANASEVKLAPRNTHAETWNAFANSVFKLHKQQIANRDIEIQSRLGGYPRNPEFYIDKKYIDRKSGFILSRIRWERKNPENIHVIEVFVHDQKGRVIRDYSAAFLPHYRRAPSQTLISRHHYDDNLHAFRSFDASGDLIFERCQGSSADGNAVDIMLDEDTMDEAQGDKNGIFFTSIYKQCFTSIPKKIEINNEFR